MKNRLSGMARSAIETARQNEVTYTLRRRAVAEVQDCNDPVKLQRVLDLLR